MDSPLRLVLSHYQSRRRRAASRAVRVIAARIWSCELSRSVEWHRSEIHLNETSISKWHSPRNTRDGPELGPSKLEPRPTHMVAVWKYRGVLCQVVPSGPRCCKPHRGSPQNQPHGPDNKVTEILWPTEKPSGSKQVNAIEAPTTRNRRILRGRTAPVGNRTVNWLSLRTYVAQRWRWLRRTVAPTRLYGRPENSVTLLIGPMSWSWGILDVVYNHLGPDETTGTVRPRLYHKPLTNVSGARLQFDGPNSGPVREYFLANATLLDEEFPLDGFSDRATQQIFIARKTISSQLLPERLEKLLACARL